MRLRSCKHKIITIRSNDWYVLIINIIIESLLGCSIFSLFFFLFDFPCIDILHAIKQIITLCFSKFPGQYSSSRMHHDSVCTATNFNDLWSLEWWRAVNRTIKNVSVVIVQNTASLSDWSRGYCRWLHHCHDSSK